MLVYFVMFLTASIILAFRIETVRVSVIFSSMPHCEDSFKNPKSKRLSPARAMAVV